MINILEFDMDINYKWAWNIAARSVYHVNDNLEECMILYKYKLSDVYIWTKFGTSDPDRIIFDKLVGKSLIIFHSEIFKDKIDRFKELIDFCVEKEIDVYIPISRYYKTHTEIMKEYVTKFEHQNWNFTEMEYNKDIEVNGIVKETLKPLIRQIKLRNLL